MTATSHQPGRSAYILIAYSGVYEERCTRLVRAFLDLDTAEGFMLALRSAAGALRQQWLDWYYEQDQDDFEKCDRKRRRLERQCLLDPQVSLDDDTEYVLQRILLDESTP